MAHPEVVAFEVMHGCNFGCSFCYVPERSPATQEWILPPLDVTFRILQRLRDSGVNEIYLVGGEPTLHPHFEEICLRVGDLGFSSRGMITNGSLLTPRLATFLGELGYWVDVSIRGVNERAQARLVRRASTLDKVIDGLHHLTAAGVPTAVEFDCLRENYRELWALAELLIRKEGLRLEGIFLHRISPYGVAATMPPEQRLNHADYLAVLQQAARIKREFHLPVAFEDGLPLCLFPESLWDHIVPCDCGYRLATVDPIGNVRRCACHPWALGNVLEQDMAAIWGGLAPFRDQSWLSPECRQCSGLAKCGGGCAASAPGEEFFGRDMFVDSFQSLASHPGGRLRIHGQAIVPNDRHEPR